MCVFHIRNVLRFINPPPLLQLTKGNLSQFATEMREGESDSPGAPAPETGISVEITCIKNTHTQIGLCVTAWPRDAQTQSRQQQACHEV